MSPQTLCQIVLDRPGVSSFPRAPSPEKWQSFSVEKDSGLINSIYTRRLVSSPFLLRAPPPLQSVGPVSKLAQDQELSKKPRLFTGTTTLSLLPFSGCRCPEGARLSEPCSQLCARQALLTAPLTLLVVAGNVVSCSLLIRSRPCPLLRQKSIIPMDGDEPRPGLLSFDHLPRPAEESNRRTSWWCWGPFSPEHSRWRW